jgi:hypothetical protein
MVRDGNARVTAFEPNGKIFIGDVSEGDLWFSPPPIRIPFKAWDLTDANSFWFFRRRDIF